MGLFGHGAVWHRNFKSSMPEHNLAINKTYLVTITLWLPGAGAGCRHQAMPSPSLGEMSYSNWQQTCEFPCHGGKEGLFLPF